MYGLPDSFTGNAVRNVLTTKRGSRKTPIADFENMEGWLELVMYWKQQREAKKEARRLKSQPASAPTFTPREEKEQKVRIRVVDD